MTRIALTLYIDPGNVDVFVNVRLNNGLYRRFSATIDTGAAVSLFPLDLLDQFEHRLTENSSILLDQAGIAKQSFQATEAFIHVFLEDLAGGRTQDFEVRAWFADTNILLLGFDGILDRATLFADFRQTRTGWIELDN